MTPLHWIVLWLVVAFLITVATRSRRLADRIVNYADRCSACGAELSSIKEFTDAKPKDKEPCLDGKVYCLACKRGSRCGCEIPGGVRPHPSWL